MDEYLCRTAFLYCGGFFDPPCLSDKADLCKKLRNK